MKKGGKPPFFVDEDYRPMRGGLWGGGAQF